ncbi:MAG: hypothetical protein QM770_12790 [Tepidisphaeraceae bacterium]
MGHRKSPGGFYFGPPPKAEMPKVKRVKKAPPELATRARELRDRWMERQDEFVALAAGKYDVARTLHAAEPPARALAA